jgi:hypothetical protein
MEKNPIESDSLPLLPDKLLLEMNQLMADKAYRIKDPFSFIRPDKTDKISREFVLYALNDYVGHLQKCIADTRKILPLQEKKPFYDVLRDEYPLVEKFVKIIFSIEIKQISQLLNEFQNNADGVTVRHLVPFVRLVLGPLVRVYYVGSSGISRLYKFLLQYVLFELNPGNDEELKKFAFEAVNEWYYVFNKIYVGLYPLLLRMCASSMLSMNELYYQNGSRVLAWLGLTPADVVILKEGDYQKLTLPEPLSEEEKIPVNESIVALPNEVKSGLDLLELMFPEAGWERLETLPDMCPYFLSIVQFQDAFIQLSPQNPLQQMLIMFWILEELFQGLRLIKFEPLPAVSLRDDTEDINVILEEWILYQETVFDKNFSADLKAYTHQIYTQPDFFKNPYGRKLLSNMYTILKHVFFPWFDIRMYGTTRAQKDERLPPFYTRVSRLKRLLVRYSLAIETAPPGSDQNPEGSVPGVANPWAPYKFDIANPVSRRVDALCGGKHSKAKTNATLIKYTLSILNVLDWWVNDKDSFAYRDTPEYLYRVISSGSSIPAFGVNAKKDIDQLFFNKLKAIGHPSASSPNP